MASKAVIVAVLLVATVLAAASAAKLPSQFYQYKFEAYMRAFNKQYDEQELGARFAAFQANYDYVEAQNARFAAGESSYELEMNQFADLTREEFAKQRLVRFNSTRARNVVLLPESGLPSSVDWRKKNAVTPVKNQEQCGSNWAFSATGSIEGAWAIAKGKLVSLSEQQLVDCSGSFGNQGCCGGFMDNAFQYIISNGGIDTEADYPYTGVDGTCDTQKQAKHAVSISGFQDVTPNNEAQLQAAVAKVPVSVAFDASSSDMQLYKSGIFDGQCTTNIDHGAVAVGYGTANGKDYWIIKNDWGTSWGVQGYIFLSRGYSGPAGQCGVAILPSYAVVNRADEQEQQQQQEQQQEQPTNGPHYEAPPCQSGEVAVQIQGIAGTFCSPKCSSRQPCPTDVPSGTTAKPECVLEMPGHASPTNCALICSPGPNAGCPSGATCQAIQGTGVCTYPKA